MDFENNALEETTPEAEDMDADIFAEERVPEAQPEAEQAPEQAAQEGQETDPKAEPVFKIKYNGQEQELPVSQLVTLAQKGMNYDHVYGELNQLRSAPEFQLLDRMAAANGMNRQQYLQAVQQQMQEAEVQKQTARGVPEDVARRLFSLEQERRQRAQAERQRQAQEAKQRQMLELAQEYPDIKEFPQEVLDAIAAGETPLAAYRAWDLRQTKQKLETMMKNAEIRRKTPGSAAGDAPQEDPDGFLDAFHSALHG